MHTASFTAAESEVGNQGLEPSKVAMKTSLESAPAVQWVRGLLDGVVAMLILVLLRKRRQDVVLRKLSAHRRSFVIRQTIINLFIQRNDGH